MAGIAVKNARVISCSHKNGYTGLSSADRTVFSPMECLINQKLWFTGRPSSSCFLFQNNSVGPRFSRLPQKRRWRKSGLVERRRNDFQKLNRYSCVRNICFWGSLEARRGLRRIKHLRGFSWRGFLIRSRNESSTCIDICPNCTGLPLIAAVIRKCRRAWLRACQYLHSSIRHQEREQQVHASCANGRIPRVGVSRRLHARDNVTIMRFRSLLSVPMNYTFTRVTVSKQTMGFSFETAIL